ncbi:hypothetical protein ACFWPB_23275, partial [Rhodococcus sp. NPDC058514]
MAHISRRAFIGLAGLGAAGTIGVGSFGRAPWGTWYAAADPLPASFAGTTLEAVATPVGGGGGAGRPPPPTGARLRARGRARAPPPPA